MLIAGPSLADMLATVDPLLASCVACWEEHAESFKTLRLVSKEISCTVEKSARRCSLQLGKEAHLKSAQVVRLMRESQLDHLNVTIITTPGCPHGPSILEQVDTCTSQLAELLQGLRPALESVTTLTVRVTHQLLEDAAQSGPCIPPLPPCCPDSFAGISRSVCEMLAPAVSALQALSVEGCCWDAALKAFGASCLQLTGLRLDPMTACMKMLEGAGEVLGSLATLTLKTRYLPDDTEEDLLSGYVADALSGLQSSKSLSKLVLDLDPSFILDCGGRHLTAPNSLRELFSSCECQYLDYAPELISGLHSLSSVISNMFIDVCHILKEALNLQQLCVIGPSELIMDQDMLSMIHFLKARLLAGLKLLLPPSIELRGSRSTVQCLLAKLPPLASVLSCTIAVIGNQLPFPLTDVARVFPNLTELHLLDQIVHEVSGSSIQHLGCLVTCTSLKRLTVRAALACSTAELASLFQNMPSLEFFGFLKCQCVSLEHLLSAVSAQGHFLQVEEYGYVRSMHNLLNDFM